MTSRTTMTVMTNAIVRTWSATASSAGADDYSRYFAGTLLPQLRALPGFVGAYLLRREAGGAGGAGGGMMGATTTLTGSEQQIYHYVSAHRDGASYLLAVSSWTEASPYIEATGQEVMPMGGFSGSVPEPTLARVKQLVKTGQLKFFLLNGSGGGFGGGGPGGGRGATASTIESWVQGNCQTVPARDYAGSSTQAGTLYACSSGS
jgi:hypothetical protein